MTNVDAGAVAEKPQTIAEESKPKLRGWIAYFRLAEVKGVFEVLEGWVRHKLPYTWYREFGAVKECKCLA